MSQQLTGPSAQLGDTIQIVRSHRRGIPGRRAQRWHWRLISANHRVICSSEPVTNMDDALEVARTRFPGCLIRFARGSK